MKETHCVSQKIWRALKGVPGAKAPNKQQKWRHFHDSPSDKLTVRRKKTCTTVQIIDTPNLISHIARPFLITITAVCFRSNRAKKKLTSWQAGIVDFLTHK
jgi:hypothetical protein